MRHHVFWIGCAAVLLVSFLIAISGINEYFFFAAYFVLTFVVLATAWNVLGGYAGYVNFGTPAFFGVGILTLRLRGIFFAIATVAVIFIMETLMVNWRYVGGATGLQLLRPAALEPFASYTRMLFVIMAAMAIGAVAAARYIQISWIGRGLRALRDSEEAAESAGVPTLRLKLFACTVSGALMAAAGAPMPMYLSFIEPASTFNRSYTIGALGSSIIGGMSHWLGPIVGALLLGTLQQIITVTVPGEVNVLVVGVLLVVFVVLAPDGILGLFKRWRKAS